MLESLALYLAASTFLGITAICGMFVLAPLGDSMIYGACAFFLPLGMAVWYLFTGDGELASTIMTTTTIVALAIPAGAFAVSTAVAPKPDKVLLTLLTTILLISAWGIS